MRLTILPNNTQTKVRLDSNNEQGWLMRQLAFEGEGSFSSKGDVAAFEAPRRENMFRVATETFPTGYAAAIRRGALKEGFDVEVVDTRTRPGTRLGRESCDWLYPYQHEAVEAVIHRSRGILSLPTGCHRAGQLVLRADGTTVAVEDVQVGDQLMGPDSGPRNVLALCRGRSEMARIVPVKGKPWVVNLDHVLSLVRTQDGSITDVTVREWLTWNGTNKHVHKLYRVGINGQDPLRTGFSVEVLDGVEDYFGFRLDGDHRYLLDDLTVTHNSGKGEICCGIMRMVPDVRWLVIAPEADLMYNISDRWAKRQDDEGCGLLGDSKALNLDYRIVSATMQTLSLRLRERTTRNSMEQFLKGFQGVIFDEVHQSPSDGAWLVLNRMTSAFYRVGLSGTALARGDSRNVYTKASFGDTVYRVEAQTLIDQKFIAKPNIYRVPNSIKSVKGKRFDTQYKQGITNNRRRNAIITKIAVKSQKPCLIRVKYQSHGAALVKSLKDAGHRAVFVHGKMKMHQRDKIIADLRNGDLDIAIASKVWQTGTDIPELRTIIIAQGMKSAIEIIQSIGRGLRVVRDMFGTILKDEVDVYDFMDLDTKVKNPATNRMIGTTAKVFGRHSKERKEHCLANGYSVVDLGVDELIRFGIMERDLAG